SILMGYPPEICGMTGQCEGHMVIEADGSTYPCDFYAIGQWRLGNILESTFEELKNMENMKNFRLSSLYIDPKCKACKYFYLCRGSCRRNREPFQNELPVLNYYCSAYYEFFEYTEDRLKNLAAILLSRKQG
ncbi:MAG: SPASM domain-containing protein, partial [Ruminiclostridium sp.]